RVGFRGVQAAEAFLDVGRQDLEGLDVKVLGRFLDGGEIELHRASPLFFLAFRQAALSRNSSPAATDTPPVTATTVFCQSRQARNSMASRRSPPVMWAASRMTSPVSASFTSGISVQLRNASMSAACSTARP